MASEELTTLYPLLQVLAELDPEKRKIVIKFLNEEGCGGLYNCIHNGLYNDQLSKKRRRAIKKCIVEHGEQEKFRCVLEPDISPTDKQNRLVEIGGAGLGILLNALLPVLAQHIFSK